MTRTGKIRVTQILEATTGGTRRHLVDLATRLDRNLFAVDVVCSTLRDPGFLADIEAMRQAGAAVSIVQMVRPIGPWPDMAALLRLVRHVRAVKPCIVHTHSAKAGFLGRLAARYCRVPRIVHTPHQFPFQMDVAAWRRNVYLKLETMAAAWTSRFICVCEHERRTALERGLASPEQVVVIPNGVELPAPAPAARLAALRRELALPHDGLVFGFVGRLVEQKDPLTLLRAMKRVLINYPHATLVMVGGGPLRDMLERHAELAGIGQACRFVGPREDARAFYALFDIVVIPSRWEALPYVLLDAMAHGCAVIASNVGGIPEAIEDGTTGLLTPVANPVALADAMERLAADPDVRHQLGSAARETIAQKFRLSENVQAVADLYRGLAVPDAVSFSDSDHGRFI